MGETLHDFKRQGDENSRRKRYPSPMLEVDEPAAVGSSGVEVT